jgi:hypothetical protein
LGAGDWFPLTIVDASANLEIVKVTGRAGAILTIVRGQEGTTARSFAAGSKCDLRQTAAAIDAKVDVSALDTDGTLANNSDQKVATQKAAKSYVDTAISAIKGGVSSAFDTLAEIATALTTLLPLAGGTMAGDIDMNGNDLRKLATLNDGPLGGLRNKLLNGDFYFYERASAQSIAPTTGVSVAAGASAYVLDRWRITNNTNQAVVISQQLHTLGQSGVPGSPKFKMRAAFATAPTSGTLRVAQRVEGSDTLSGSAASARGYFTGPAGAEVLACEIVQNFGTGGSPSPSVTTGAASLDVATIYNAATQSRKALFAIPTIAGKTLGTSGDYLELAWTLTPRQAGNYELSHMSLVEGDASSESDPFSPRPNVLELALIRRYFWYEFVVAKASRRTIDANGALGFSYNFPVRMRALPALGYVANLGWADGEAQYVFTTGITFGRIHISGFSGAGGLPSGIGSTVNATWVVGVPVYGDAEL